MVLVKWFMETSLPQIKDGWVRALLFFIAVPFVVSLLKLILFIPIALISGTGSLFEILWLGLNSNNNKNELEILGMSIITLFGTVYTVFLFQKFINRTSTVLDSEFISSMGFEFSRYKNDFVSGLFFGFVLSWLGFLIFYIFNLSSPVLAKVSFLDQLIYILFFVIISLNNGIIIWGYIFHNLSSSFNRYTSLFFAALAFMYLNYFEVLKYSHFASTYNVMLTNFNVFLVGLFIGVYCIHKKNLWFPIGAHFALKYFQGPVFGFQYGGYAGAGNWIDSIVNQTLWKKLKPNIVVHEGGVKSATSPINYYDDSILITGGKFYSIEGSIIFTGLMVLGIILVHKRYSTS